MTGEPANTAKQADSPQLTPQAASGSPLLRIEGVVKTFGGFRAVDGGLPPGKALPIVRARLRLGERDESKPVAPGDQAVAFTVPLKAGTKVPMETSFYDAQGNELCGAYFAYIRRR